MALLVEGVLAFLVLSGCVTIVWGVRRFKLSARVLTIAFALTAISWMALLITTISLTVRTLVFPPV
ncbi:MAG TPA: hypothetical protein VFS21_31420 [Roseiflexaceae bacterium]|nr:hypothetical protein [Roseiflexaceae bacterium]